MAGQGSSHASPPVVASAAVGSCANRREDEDEGRGEEWREWKRAMRMMRTTKRLSQARR